MKELEIAIKAATEAGKIHLRYFQKRNFILRNKNPRDLVTTVDLEAEKRIISIIKERFPSHTILAEESGTSSKGCEFSWVIDPLDGTANFVRGNRDFCVLISLVKNQKTLFGITFFPLTNEVYVAQNGKGATKNGKPIRVSSESDVSKMYGGTHMSSNLKDRGLNFELYKKVLFKVRNVHVINACISRLLTDVAEGVCDFQFRAGFHYWDYAAGSLLVEEAGGKATDLSGEPITLSSKNTLISNGKSHKKLLKIIKL